jgi:predicted nucleotidyltransferase/DNA-binding XRE family transcriptional regulator
MQMTLKELRKQKKLTQKSTAEYLGVPLRTYQNYEWDENKSQSLKYRYMVEKLSQYGQINEETGILSVSQIADACAEVFPDYPVEFCYLFGSYAKGTAKEMSDIDLLIGGNVSGITFFDLVEVLRSRLHKRIDALNLEQLKDNPELLHEILKDGVKIYESNQE